MLNDLVHIPSKVNLTTALLPVNNLMLQSAFDNCDAQGVCQVFGQPLGDIVVVAQVVSMDFSDAKLVILLEDETGRMEARRFLECSREDTLRILRDDGVEINGWVRLVGRLQHYHYTELHICVYRILGVSSINERFLHQIQVCREIHRHLPDDPSTPVVEEPPQGVETSTMMEVLNLLKQDVGPRGLSCVEITQKLQNPQVSVNDVEKITFSLGLEGLVYETIDSFHFKAV